MVTDANGPDPDDTEGTEIPSEAEDAVSKEHMEFGIVLRRWRTAAGQTQLVVARALKLGERTYRKIERGERPPRFKREQCENLARLLDLDKHERHVLLLYNVGTALPPTPRRDHPELDWRLRLLINRQMPSPAYLCDPNWNILAYNEAMAQWWPWVTEPDANLMKWALLSPAARTQFHDWTQHVSIYVHMLKFALAAPGDHNELLKLIQEVRKDPHVRHACMMDSELIETRDGHVFRMSVPALAGETIEVVSHVLRPAGMPDCRLVVLTRVENDERDGSSGESGSDVGSHQRMGVEADPQRGGAVPVLMNSPQTRHARRQVSSSRPVRSCP
ncbi:hypothetical protein GCM10009654_14720 [Streptomyces hebeiensis]|uniref:HTH cro/C1-type domain-containing protein n=1 Tax=Streptomyces hebeiensis TaxID=229486 RepID=A0ABN1UMX9_9ACTN